MRRKLFIIEYTDKYDAHKSVGVSGRDSTSALKEFRKHYNNGEEILDVYEDKRYGNGGFQ